MVSFYSLSSFLLYFSLFSLLQFLNFIDAQAQAQAHNYPTATLSTQWMNNATTFPCRDGSTVLPIMARAKNAYGPAYACGFYCNGNCSTYLLAVFIALVDSDGTIGLESIPQVVWSANRKNPVKIGAVLELTTKGDLLLKDLDGTIAWSTNTSGKSVVGLNLTDFGSLELFNEKNETIWQSFDQPTDTLVPRQKLMVGQRLMTTDDMITLSLNDHGISAQMETSPPQIYLDLYFYFFDQSLSDEPPYLEFVNGSLAVFSNSTTKMGMIPIPPASSAQYMKLGSDGHLRVYEWVSEWKEVADVLKDNLSDCAYPKVCGPYGICSNGQCSCPASSGRTSYFKQVDDRHPNLGCSENVPLSCGASQYHSFLELHNISYFTFHFDIVNIDASSCKEACAKNCSCKAAIFQYSYCYLPNQVFSLINTEVDNSIDDFVVYLKVQNETNQASNTSVDSQMSNHQNETNQAPKNSVDNRMSNRLPVILGSSLGALSAMMFFIVLIVLFVRKRDDNETEEDYLDQVPGMPSRFTYNDLKAVTNNFSKKLGKGGFGSVFEGTLPDGTKVAVKQLDGFGQVKKSFLAEVETIGSIHHVNLVRLIGFCAEKSCRLLIYEYMSNGSLDRWIFCKSNECVLDWQQRKKIVLDIAKGLNYLHEDCRHKIVHLDIKPQNILLDGNFNAKVADFGLSKLIDRDQSQVITTMRGTPGYLAPEWLSAAITEKVDVYSFGVVILEIVCGRKIFDRSLDEEDMHLLSLFKRKAEEERMLDIVDDRSEDMQLNASHVVNMLRIAAWCLQGDYTRRPSMSTVIKVLEGVSEVQDDLDYNFSAQPSTHGAAKFCRVELEFSATTALLPSVLSGAR